MINIPDGSAGGFPRDREQDKWDARDRQSQELEVPQKPINTARKFAEVADLLNRSRQPEISLGGTGVHTLIESSQLPTHDQIALLETASRLDRPAPSPAQAFDTVSTFHPVSATEHVATSISRHQQSNQAR